MWWTMAHFSLHLATELGELVKVKELIENKGGAIINEVDSNGSTALHIAADFEHIKVAKYLLEHGADVNAITNPEKQGPLHLATENNNFLMVQLFTEAGANIQCIDYDGNMPIHIAADMGYIEIIKYFLEKGIDIDIINESSKMTPLQMAAHRGHIEVIDYLLLNNANLHLKDYQNRSSIHHGVLGKRAKIVHSLIKKGVDINVEDIHYLTPLHLACREGNLEIVQLLLENGAVCNLKERFWTYSPLHWSETNYLKIIKYFINIGVDLNFGTSQECTVLHVACKRGEIEIVKFLIENGADVNKKTLPNTETAGLQEDSTLLCFAILNLRTDVAEFLILNGADLKEAEYKGKSSLSIALEYIPRKYIMSARLQTDLIVLSKVLIKYNVLIYNPSHTIIQDDYHFFKELLQYYKDCQKEISSMKSVIIRNSTVSLYQIICDFNRGKALVKYLCNDNIRNELQNLEEYLKDFSIYGNINPLIQLRVKEGLKRMELLTDADLIMIKIAPQLPSEIRYTILEYLNMTDLKTFLKAKWSDFPRHLATELEKLEAHQLIEGGAILNEVDSNGSTALHKAVDFRDLGLAKKLLELGADVNSVNNPEKQCPLHFATAKNNIEMVRLLTEAGANMQCSDFDGDMPIHIAAKEGHIKIIKYFLKKGMDIDIINENTKMTPLQMAAYRGHMEVVDFLLLNNANVNLKDYQNRSSIHHGVLGGKAKIVHGLIEKGVDINVEDIYNLTPLHLACKKYFEIVKLLLKNGAVCNLEEGFWTYSNKLHCAYEPNYLKIVKYFISIGIDVNFGTSQKCTVLHVACKWGEIEIVKFLIKNGADVNKKTTLTPLCFAILNLRTEIAELLILNGADLKEAEYKGKSSLSIALNYLPSISPISKLTELMDLAKVIIKYTVLIYNPVETIIQDDRPFIKELLQYYNECQNQITNMKSVLIKNSTVSLYQIICDSNNVNALFKYLYNDNIKNELQNIEDYIKDFSIYGNISPLVQLRVKEGLQRMELLTDADLIMKKIAPQLPSEIRYTILEYLNMTDLKTVIKLDLFK
ncbi:ankyrin-1-like [Diabrotica virgifera virgifera]|uniref:PRANC domain-containing protein n=1 Tax=Diabrotica virgifera virgifera TaxID=50390 RepID=A0ABM5K0C8_DIAVI|nr:ankyrin-1-like [Diabrotica virgifera virgifera]